MHLPRANLGAAPAGSAKGVGAACRTAPVVVPCVQVARVLVFVPAPILCSSRAQLVGRMRARSRAANQGLVLRSMAATFRAFDPQQSGRVSMDFNQMIYAFSNCRS